MIKREWERRAAYTTHRDVVERCGVCELSVFAILNSRQCICSKKFVKCLLSLREQDNNLLLEVFKKKNITVAVLLFDMQSQIICFLEIEILKVLSRKDIIH